MGIKSVHLGSYIDQHVTSLQDRHDQKMHTYVQLGGGTLYPEGHPLTIEPQFFRESSQTKKDIYLKFFKFEDWLKQGNHKTILSIEKMITKILGISKNLDALAQYKYQKLANQCLNDRDKARLKKEEAFDLMKEVVAGNDKFEALPTITPHEGHGIEPKDLTAPVMRGTNNDGSQFIAIKVKTDTNEEKVQIIQEVRSPRPQNDTALPERLDTISWVAKSGPLVGNRELILIDNLGCINDTLSTDINGQTGANFMIHVDTLIKNGSLELQHGNRVQKFTLASPVLVFSPTSSSVPVSTGCVIDENFIVNMRPDTLLPLPRSVSRPFSRPVSFVELKLETLSFGEFKLETQEIDVDPKLCQRVDVFEARARPGKDATSGFLGEDESLQEVLYKDWETVKKLGVTHKELADKLEYIRDNPSADENLDVRTLQTRGMQSDISILGSTDHDKYSALGFETHITHKKSNEKIVLTTLCIQYIRHYGFYEGGKGNRYRIDPITLWSFLTGEPIEDIKKRIGSA